MTGMCEERIKKIRTKLNKVIGGRVACSSAVQLRKDGISRLPAFQKSIIFTVFVGLDTAAMIE
jgi:hypothetical protein